MLRLFCGTRRDEMEHSVTFDTVRTEIARRIRRVCQNFDEQTFESMVDRMAEIEVRYRMRDDWTLLRALPRRPTFN
jgi:hypothetical protein